MGRGCGETRKPKGRSRGLRGAPEEITRPRKDIYDNRQRRSPSEHRRHIPALMDTSSLHVKSVTVFIKAIYVHCRKTGTFR